MSALSSVLVKFTADMSDFNFKMKQGLKDVQSAETEMGAVGAGGGGMLSKFKGIALPVFASVTAGAIAMGAGIKKGLGFNAQMEQASISFETFQGKILSDQAIPALLSAMGEKFDGAMAKLLRMVMGAELHLKQ